MEAFLKHEKYFTNAVAFEFCPQIFANRQQFIGFRRNNRFGRPDSKNARHFPPPTASVDITPIDTVGKPMAHLFKSKVD